LTTRTGSLAFCLEIYGFGYYFCCGCLTGDSYLGGAGCCLTGDYFLGGASGSRFTAETGFSFYSLSVF